MAFNWFKRNVQSVIPQQTRSTASMEVLEGRQLMSASALADLTLDASTDAATAVTLGTIDKAKTVKSETVGMAGDPADFYTFTVTANTNVVVKLKSSGKVAKAVKPTLQLTNSLEETATGGSAKSLKQVVGAGTYYISVSGQPVAAEPGATYKLTVVTKASKKNPTFDDQPGNGGNNGQGSNGGTFTGTLVNAFTNPSPNAAVHQWEYVASTTGSFELPVTWSADTSWSAVAFDNATEMTGGGGLGVDDGTITVTAKAGQKYIFSILYGGQTSTSYSITFDASFSKLKRSNFTQ